MILSESMAILAYLCDKFGSIPSHYYPADLESRAKVNEMCFWYQSYYRDIMFRLIRLKVFETMVFGLPLTPEKIQSANDHILKALTLLNTLLSNQQFLCGKNPSIADLLVFF